MFFILLGLFCGGSSLFFFFFFFNFCSAENTGITLMHCYAHGQNKDIMDVFTERR